MPSLSADGYIRWNAAAPTLITKVKKLLVDLNVSYRPSPAPRFPDDRLQPLHRSHLPSEQSRTIQRDSALTYYTAVSKLEDKRAIFHKGKTSIFVR